MKKELTSLQEVIEAVMCSEPIFVIVFNKDVSEVVNLLTPDTRVADIVEYTKKYGEYKIYSFDKESPMYDSIERLVNLMYYGKEK